MGPRDFGHAGPASTIRALSLKSSNAKTRSVAAAGMRAIFPCGNSALIRPPLSVSAPDMSDDRVKLTLELLATVCGKLDRTEHAPAVVVSRLLCEASQMGRRGSRKARYFPCGKIATTRRPSLVPAPDIEGCRVRTKSLPPLGG